MTPRGHPRQRMSGGRMLLCGCRLRCCRDWGKWERSNHFGRPFLATAKAIIYTDTAKIVFTINGRKERFNFKNKILKAPAHPRYPYPQEHEPVVEKKEEIEGGIRTIIDLNRMWRKFGWSTWFYNRMRTCSLNHHCQSLRILEFHQSTAPSINGTSSELSATQDRTST
jgi:hypothetical protein